MGRAKIPSKVKLFAGLLYTAPELSKVETLLEELWGAVQFKSGEFPFTYSHYYDEELGPDIKRRFYVFQKCIDPEEIREVKIESNRVELENASNDLRKWNIDPGYIDLDKIVLATTKPATYRIYLGKGIYAQSTLFFKDKTYHPWSWTYRDYKEPRAIEFFNTVREQFKKEGEHYGHHQTV